MQALLKKKELKKADQAREEKPDSSEESKINMATSSANGSPNLEDGDTFESTPTPTS